MVSEQLGRPNNNQKYKTTLRGGRLRYGLAMCVLFCAAVLEAGGDALMRFGLRSPTHARAAVFFAVGGLVLAFYGYVVNAPAWDFGRLIGVYVVMFFLVAQLIAWIGFGQKPAPLVLLGGTLIVIGGCVVSLSR
jgi:small multidrug resistance family-3 protein